MPSDSVRNLTAQIFSSTAIIISWDPPLEPNGRPYYLLSLQEAGLYPEGSNQGAPAVNKTIRHTTTDNVFLFTKLRKYFPYVLTVTPATSAGPAYNHTSTMYLRTDDDSEFGEAFAFTKAVSIMSCDTGLSGSPFSSKFCPGVGVDQESVLILHRGSMATPSGGQRRDNRVHPHSVWPWGLQHYAHIRDLVHPPQPASIHGVQPQRYSRNP